MASVYGEVVPNSYIVVLKPSVDKEQFEDHCSWANHCCHQRKEGFSTAEASQYNGIEHRYDLDGWRGYSCTLDEETRQEIEKNDEVDFVEPDIKMYAKEIVNMNAPSWGLGRISHKVKGTAEDYKSYIYDDNGGEGTTIYVVDTGILAGHKDFAGRAKFGHNAVLGSSETDKNGHGTHCAGTAGGTNYGVAKKARIIGVKVLGDDGSGTNSGVIAGLQWALADAQSKGIVKKSVISMSLGGGKSIALNNAVKSIIAQGLTVCVAAGNESTDAKYSSPASEPSCITVGAIDVNDKMSTFSNYGELVDVFAPGTAITSCWIDETGGNALDKTITISGTSMATPHVAGLAAYLMSIEGLEGADQVIPRIKELAVRDLITGIKLPNATPNRLAFNGVEQSSDSGNPTQKPIQKPSEEEKKADEPKKDEDSKKDEEL